MGHAWTPCTNQLYGEARYSGGDLTCTKEYQLFSLFIFFTLTGGPNWNMPWPLPANGTDWDPAELMLRNCTQSSGNFSAVVPEWCCWYGVSCCLSSDPCPINTLDTTPCGNCTVGQVTALDLGYNNVIYTDGLLSF